MLVSETRLKARSTSVCYSHEVSSVIVYNTTPTNNNNIYKARTSNIKIEFSVLYEIQI